MSRPRPPHSIRPYNAYNIFFQLERSRILQLEHHYHDPALDSPALTFDATDPTSDYTGPPRLPERYRQVILPIDWHLPNKIKKRKRLHRKSHGRIGFHALNQQISRAWGNVEEEVRIFLRKPCSNRGCEIPDGNAKRSQRALHSRHQLRAYEVKPRQFMHRSVAPAAPLFLRPAPSAPSRPSRQSRLRP
ncbi:hypothetical protein THAOC_26489 [Thalassiosira oceanica]|uniref:HMG box domain-containing protein n=1 Tax=Thalassiosira oceanica TaxID=159749 RepID=K0S4Z1_THAOC|nr:hypothetical protein THAOC_26489 [Thalassiosira oceanica]|eukprot:EJK53972.1 hypothetical protein THAOC_26489 [Thalassiosira oceanica]